MTPPPALVSCRSELRAALLETTPAALVSCSASLEGAAPLLRVTKRFAIHDSEALHDQGGFKVWLATEALAL